MGKKKKRDKYGTVEDGVLEPTQRTPRSESRPNTPPLRRFTRSVLFAVKLQNPNEEDGEEPKAGLQACLRVDPSRPRPSAWNDCSHDANGLKRLCQEDWMVISAGCVLVPIAIIVLCARAGPVFIFCCSFAGLLPLALKLGDLTEMLTGWCGPVAGGLLTATLGNAMEVIVTISALSHSLVGVEQAMLLGGILSNTLLVLGAAFLIGGLEKMRPQYFDQRTTSATVGLLYIGCLGIILPTAFAVARRHYRHNPQMRKMEVDTDETAVLIDSRLTSCVLLFMYLGALRFTLWPSPAFELPKVPGISKPERNASKNSSTPLLKGESETSDDEGSAEVEEVQTPYLSGVTITACLFTITAFVALLSNALVQSIFPVSLALHIPPDFIAVVLLPIVGNVAELATAVIAARRDKMDLAIAVALGGATQIALFIVPMAVLFGWLIGVPMNMDFQPVFALAFFGSVFGVSLLVQEGESHWLKGLALLGAYVIVASGVALAPGISGATKGAPPMFPSVRHSGKVHKGAPPILQQAMQNVPTVEDGDGNAAAAAASSVTAATLGASPPYGTQQPQQHAAFAPLPAGAPNLLNHQGHRLYN